MRSDCVLQGDHMAPRSAGLSLSAGTSMNAKPAAWAKVAAHPSAAASSKRIPRPEHEVKRARTRKRCSDEKVMVMCWRGFEPRRLYLPSGPQLARKGLTDQQICIPQPSHLGAAKSQPMLGIGAM
jgi:hypothetical protein